MRRLTRYGVIVAAGLLAAGCSAGSGSSSSSSSGSTSGNTSTSSVLTISNENGALWTCGFNPLNPSDNLLSVGFIYEPLIYVNPLQGGKTTPMLASSYTWGAGNKSLTFTIRQGVKWSDGTPMTAADVAYTFNLEKKYPALDLTGVWSVLSSVTATGNTVTMDFSTVAVPYFYYIADQTPIVPEHIWSTLSNPTTDPITHPVGTGPFLMNKCSPSNITYTANPHYWQPGLPKIKKIEYPAYTSNTTANNDLANGTAQWGAQYIPAIDTFYKSKSPNYHYWFPPTVNVSLVPNLTNPLLSNVKVREAMSYAIDRAKVSTIGESGYEPPANQTGIVTPTFSSSQDSSAVSAWGNGYDPAKATSLLESAGFHMGSDGIMANSAGQKLAFTVHQHRRLLRLGRLGAGHPAGAQGGRHPDHAGQPVQHRLRLRLLLRQVPARLLRPADLRPERVLRAEQLAQLREHGAGRQVWRPAITSATATRPPTSCSTSTRPPRTRPRSSRS